ncbi:MAG: DNA recombination protein RmuC [Oligoflexia bacterium]|nr:DNA recombination protein RmuC [Oligoflexia bacterium]
MPSTFLPVFLAVLLLAIVAVALVGALQYLRMKAFLAQLPDALQRPILDLSERVTRISTETRESTTERLARHFLDTQERLDRTLAQNRQELAQGLQKSTQALESKFQSLEQQVGLRLETIGKNVETKLNENLKEGFRHFEKVQEHLQAAELKLASLNTVGQSISDLNSLLKLPHLRGGFGEATLERLLADFLPIGSYELQFAVVPGSTERVDAIVRFAKQILPIDSKFPREQVLPLFESQNPEDVESARKLLSDFVKGQAKSIADKYIRPDHGTTDMALLFLPSETLYFEVIRNGKLFESLSKLKVFPVSPNTLSISLKAVAMAQDYYEMARGVEKTIEDVKKARRHFEHFEKKFEEIGKGLRKAQEAFETANTHLSHYENSIFRLTGEVENKEAPAQLALTD